MAAFTLGDIAHYRECFICTYFPIRIRTYPSSCLFSTLLNRFRTRVSHGVNPRPTLVLCVCVCLSVCYHSSCFSVYTFKQWLWIETRKKHPHGTNCVYTELFKSMCILDTHRCVHYACHIQYQSEYRTVGAVAVRYLLS